MLNSPEVFRVTPVTFEKGQADPFGFDDLAEKVGEVYVPFAGATRRIRYLLFLPIVDLLLNELKIPDRAKRGNQRRLEKLFAYLALNEYKLPPGSGILGSSLKDMVRPFNPSAGTWIVVDCFRLYSSSVRTLGLNTDEALAKIKKSYLTPRFVAFMRSFLAKQGGDTAERKWLSDLRKKQPYKGTIYDFNTPIRSAVVRFLWKSVFDSDQVKRLTDWYPLLRKNPSKYTGRIRQDKKYPFRALNDFFANTFDAISAETSNEKLRFWNKAYTSLGDVRETHAKLLSKSGRVKPWRGASSASELVTGLYHAAENNARGWFRYEHGGIIPGPRLPSGFLEVVMERIKRADYADFRLYALESIINDLNKRGVR